MIVAGTFSIFVYIAHNNNVQKLRKENTEFKKRVTELNSYANLKLKDLTDKANGRYTSVATSYDKLNNSIDKYDKTNRIYSTEKQKDLTQLSKDTAKDADHLRDMINSQDIFIDSYKKRILDTTYEDIKKKFSGKDTLDNVRDEMGYNRDDKVYNVTDYYLNTDSNVSVLFLRKRMNDLRDKISSNIVTNFQKNKNMLNDIKNSQTLMFQETLNNVQHLRDELVFPIEDSNYIYGARQTLSTFQAGLEQSVGTKITSNLNTFITGSKSKLIEQASNLNRNTLNDIKENALLTADTRKRNLESQNTQLYSSINQFKESWSNKFNQRKTALDTTLNSQQRIYNDKYKEIEESTKEIEKLSESLSNNYLKSSEFDKQVQNNTTNSYVANVLALGSQSNILYAPKYYLNNVDVDVSSNNDQFSTVNQQITTLSGNLNSMIHSYNSNGVPLVFTGSKKIEFAPNNSISLTNNVLNINGDVNFMSPPVINRNGKSTLINMDGLNKQIESLENVYSKRMTINVLQQELLKKSDMTHNHDSIYESTSSFDVLNDTLDNNIGTNHKINMMSNNTVNTKLVRNLNVSNINFSTGNPEARRSTLAHLQGTNVNLSEQSRVNASNIEFKKDSIALTNINFVDNSLSVNKINTSTLPTTISIPLSTFLIDDRTIPVEAISNIPIVSYESLPPIAKGGTYTLNNNRISMGKVDWSQPVSSISNIDKLTIRTSQNYDNNYPFMTSAQLDQML